MDILKDLDYHPIITYVDFNKNDKFLSLPKLMDGYVALSWDTSQDGWEDDGDKYNNWVNGGEGPARWWICVFEPGPHPLYESVPDRYYYLKELLSAPTQLKLAMGLKIDNLMVREALKQWDRIANLLEA